MTHTPEEICGACGAAVTHTNCAGWLIAVAGRPIVPVFYLLCLGCSARMRSGDPELKERVMEAVELRLGPKRGRA
jgi:hypothetical protein